MKRSAGLLLFRRGRAGIEVLLVHPGGPFWAKKDDGAWSIPKGEHEPDEDALTCARREFAEELGSAPPADPVVELGEIKQPGGKTVTAFAQEGSLDLSALVSNKFEMEWPRAIGRKQSFPEIDRAGWFMAQEARRKILSGQAPFIERLLARLS